MFMVGVRKNFVRNILEAERVKNMGDLVIILIMAVGLVFGVRETIKHMKGQGGCCKGGSVPKVPKKSLKGRKVAEKVIKIEGMHCENCKNSVERQLNRIDGAAAKVDLKKNIAVVSLERMASDEELKAAVEKAGFKVTDIQIQKG